MRTSFLQDLYLQRPVTLTILICIVSVLPWIGMGDFATKGEPREAAVAISMLETGNVVLPASYADEFAYKPPMAHWLMAAFSCPQGYVNEFTARLPSALAFIFLIGYVLVFFGKRIGKFQEVFVAGFLLITCIEIHRAGMTARVDMLLTLFTVLGLFQLYRWEELQELKGLPVTIPVLLGCAVLTKGPVGIVLPVFVFGLYLLMLHKYRLTVVVKAMLYAGISSLFLPFLWYFAAWQQGGEDFLNVVAAENFGRFFHINTLAIDYSLGHENGVWYNFATLAAGFIPWSILIVFSLFGMKIHKPSTSFKEILKNAWARICSMEKIRLFSLVALVGILFFYSIPSSKRSVYLMPAYPFIALFLAQYILYITEYRARATRVFAGFIALLAITVSIALLSVMTGIIDPVAALQSLHITNNSTLHTVQAVSEMLASPDCTTILIICLLLLSIGIVCYQIFRKINIKILYATIALLFCINLLTDGIIMRGERKSTSVRPFAEQIMRDYPLNKENVYVMNSLREYPNLYGLNFYTGNIFHNFETAQPESGYFLVGENDMPKILHTYGNRYTFRTLASTSREIKEIKQKILLSSFTTTDNINP
ncbi:4-amino-4-deoxy-L-arabinose transferase [Bacteroidales bacterium Barb6]|nr:4-amino-4-deoxy-L-arabinose transferase [Bacteroidales bacterium Barb6]